LTFYETVKIDNRRFHGFEYRFKTNQFQSSIDEKHGTGVESAGGKFSGVNPKPGTNRSQSKNAGNQYFRPGRVGPVKPISGADFVTENFRINNLNNRKHHFIPLPQSLPLGEGSYNSSPLMVEAGWG
jgi:hypothetical protein